MYQKKVQWVTSTILEWCKLLTNQLILFVNTGYVQKFGHSLRNFHETGWLFNRLVQNKNKALTNVYYEFEANHTLSMHIYLLPRRTQFHMTYKIYSFNQ